MKAGVASSPVPIALAAGGMGDVDLDLQGIGAHAMVERQGTETAGRIGDALGEAIAIACNDARASSSADVRLRVLFSEPEPAGALLSDGRCLGTQAVYGVPALAGSELGRNFMLDPSKLSTALSLEGRRSAGHRHAEGLLAPQRGAPRDDAARQPGGLGLAQNRRSSWDSMPRSSS